MTQVETRILNRRDEMPVITGVINRFGLDNRLPPAAINDLKIALDEALNNIISYAYGQDQRSEILVRLTAEPCAIVVEIEDMGRPFDPLQAPAPDLGAPLAARKVGGLGVHFIKHLMDDITYARADGKNRLRLTKRLPSPAAR